MALQIMQYTFQAIRIAREAFMAEYQPYLSNEACNPLVSRKLIDGQGNICHSWTAPIDRTLPERMVAIEQLVSTTSQLTVFRRGGPRRCLWGS